MTGVFSVQQDVFQICIQNKIFPHTWPCRGAALAGLQVELRRMAASAAQQVATGAAS